MFQRSILYTHQLKTYFQLLLVVCNSGGSVFISDLTQQTNLRNTCSGAGTECDLKANNLYFVTNNDDSPITISPYQSVSLSCSGSTDCSGDVTNLFSLTKTGGTSLTYTSSQTSTNGASNSYMTGVNGASPTASGSCQLTQIMEHLLHLQPVVKTSFTFFIFFNYTI